MSGLGRWWAGLLRRRAGRLFGAACGVAIAVALLSALGAFLAGAEASMTQRAAATVPVDWQVQLTPGATADTALAQARRAVPVRAAAPLAYAGTPGLAATAGGSTQATGPGQVLGLPESYRRTFPRQVRTLTGRDGGVLLAQQTAANLHAAPGDTITVRRPGLAPARVRVDGVVDLPFADTLFQRVGAPTGAQPSAPPDNVVLLPMTRWHTLFDSVTARYPQATHTQLHLALAHHLPADPANAYLQDTTAAHHLEAAAAGAVLVGDNLGATLDAARSDAAYAKALFLFLGVPGAVLAALLTGAVTAAGGHRRRAEQALLRTRGAPVRSVLGFALAEAVTVGVLGSGLGVGLGALVGLLAFGSARFGADPGQAVGWAAAAAGAGVLIALLTVALPAARDVRTSTVAAAYLARPRRAWYLRYPVDLVLLAGSVLVFRAAGGNQYQLVLAPEGVPSISVSYWAFAAPALLWLGAGLLVLRLAVLVLGPGRPLLARLLRPLAGSLAGPLAASLSGRRAVLARAIALLALAACFAGSTAVFNATYQAQVEVDAKLTNGADVTVTESPGVIADPAEAARLRAVPGVRAVEPLQHRFAYVGTDLQDLYGVRPESIGGVTAVRDSYFRGGSARQLLHTLATRQDAILISAETVTDFQLHPGQRLNLRLRNGRTQATVTVPFHYAGVVTEFPTAPKDSFLVANADYIARATGTDTVGTFLVDTGGTGTATVAHHLRDLLGTSAAVTDIGAVRGQVGSSLTTVDLTGLTRVELAFALVIAAAAGGLVLVLGFTERRRGLATLTALGATRRHLLRVLGTDTTVLLLGGALGGAAATWALSTMLVTVLTGVFDPPPDTLTVPGTYLLGLAASVLAALGIATLLAARAARRDITEQLRGP